jgi:hypothetical protein
MPVLNLPGSAVYHHHAGVFSFLRGMLGDQVKGKVKTELG